MIPRTCWTIEAKCPKCGRPLATDGRKIWCGHMLPGGKVRCDYGIAETVRYQPEAKS
jgi:hypothetical protein